VINDLTRLRPRLITAATMLALTSACLLGYLVWPQPTGPAPARLEEEYKRLSGEVGLWQKSNPDKVRSDLQLLYSEDVPARWSEISQRMEKLIRESGVSWTAIHYPVDSADKMPIPGVEQVKIETIVTGDYAKVARFINALEQDKTFFIIDKISLSSQEGGTVSLVITVDTFLRQATA
jgi:hypothetical protein